VLVGQQAADAVGLVAVEPGVDGVGVAGAEQAVAGDGVRGEAVGDLQRSGTALADEEPWVMVVVVRQFTPLDFG
jgi:hypothetical protein